jgi:hypothetical protein
MNYSPSLCSEEGCEESPYPKPEETVQRHFRLGVFLGVVSFCALASAEVFAVDATLSGTRDAIEQRVAPVVSRVKEPVLAGSVSISGIPEPGVVALLGFGLVVLGLSYGYGHTQSHAKRSGSSMSRYRRHLRSSQIGRR